MNASVRARISGAHTCDQLFFVKRCAGAAPLSSQFRMCLVYRRALEFTM